MNDEAQGLIDLAKRTGFPRLSAQLAIVLPQLDLLAASRMVLWSEVAESFGVSQANLYQARKTAAKLRAAWIEKGLLSAAIPSPYSAPSLNKSVTPTVQKNDQNPSPTVESQRFDIKPTNDLDDQFRMKEEEKRAKLKERLNQLPKYKQPDEN